MLWACDSLVKGVVLKKREVGVKVVWLLWPQRTDLFFIQVSHMFARNPLCVGRSTKFVGAFSFFCFRARMFLVSSVSGRRREND